MTYTARISRDAHHKEDTDSRKDDLGGGKYLKLTLGQSVIWRRAETHRANALTKGGSESVEDIHGWRKPLCESLITTPRLTEIVGFPFKHCEDGFRRFAAFDLHRERVGNKLLSGLPLVLFQGLVEDWLKT